MSSPQPARGAAEPELAAERAAAASWSRASASIAAASGASARDVADDRRVGRGRRPSTVRPARARGELIGATTDEFRAAGRSDSSRPTETEGSRHHDHSTAAPAGSRSIVLCLGDLMIVLDTTIVNVALPSIRSRPRLLGDLARLGRERVPAHLRRLPAARRPARRPVRPPAPVPRRASRCSRSPRSRCGLATTQGMLVGARACRASAARSSRPSRSR